MRVVRSSWVLGVLLAILPTAVAQIRPGANPDEDFHVYRDSPRLLLSRQRLRLLQRDRDRQSDRWQQFSALVAGGAPLPEPGFALALDYRVSGDAAVGRKAVEWALNAERNPAADLRQLALVFDWCGPVMDESQANRLAAEIKAGIGTDGGAADIARQSARALAAIAIADKLDDHGESILRPMVEQWWRGGMAAKIEAGALSLPPSELYALLELLHAVRDNIGIDLRESVPAYFEQLPLDYLAAHYPAPFPGDGNAFYVPVYIGQGEPDPKAAAFSRAAGLAMVALDTNAEPAQYLQGWLMQDRMMMRGALGAPYEFLWANPYQPGLSYALLPLVFHNPATGHVFARTSWDDDAVWIGYFDGHLQRFDKGQIETLRQGAAIPPLRVGDATILSLPPAAGNEPLKFEASTASTFVLGLAPQSSYDVEIDDEELMDGETDAGGTLVITLAPEMRAGVRIRKHEP